MNVVAQILAQDLQVYLNTRIGSVTSLDNQWLVHDDNHTLLGRYDWIICAYTV
ncbi:hypothetical protein [Francisella tularensis]|uniref:hypothetical protein n=1 Tax=Francisella tularensis TaxID=263 RepID=UPI002381A86D|nr:hypothetical protein [Francisella tularensis]MDE5002695.1 hypothetical protein [Francisella tularensis subsp. holarctica]